MSYEQTARAIHKGGNNCGQSVYACFASELGLSKDEAIQAAPKPRSEGGQCGAYLAGRALLMKLKPDSAGEFERRFLELNGATECRKLRGAGKSCNDYVGDAARLAAELLS